MEKKKIIEKEILFKECPYCFGTGVVKDYQREIRLNNRLITEKIIEFRKKGLSYAQIGVKFGVSRQRIHQLLNKMPNYHRAEVSKD